MATKFVPNSSLVSLLVWIITATLLSTVETQSISSYSAVKGPPQADQKEVKKIGRIGETVKIVCPIGGYPAPMIEWTKNGEKIDYMWDRHRTGKKSLKIKHVNADDTGIFTCKGINGFGSEEVRIEVIIIDPRRLPPGIDEDEEVAPPVFTYETKKAKRQYTKSVGETFKVTCEALGSPKPEIFWFKDGQHIDESVHYQRGKSTLEFSVMGSADGGVYTCRARNLIGEKTQNYTLEVDQPSGTRHAIVTEASPANSTVHRGETATLHCRVKSLTAPHIKWLKRLEAHEESAENTLTVGHERYRILSNSHDVPTGDHEYLNRLVIPLTTPSDSGMYICFVTNSGFGALTYKSMHLQVLKQKPPTYEVPDAQPPAPPVSPPGSAGDQEDQPVPVLILVITMAIAVLVLIIVIGVCVALKKQKAKQQRSSASEAANSSFSSGGVQGAVHQHLHHHQSEVHRPFIVNNHHPHSTLKVVAAPSVIGNNNAKTFTGIPLPAVPVSGFSTYTHTVHPAKHPSPRSLVGFVDSGHGSNDCSASTVVTAGPDSNQYEVPYSHLVQLQHQQQEAEKHQRQYHYFAQHFPRAAAVSGPQGNPGVTSTIPAHGSAAPSPYTNPPPPHHATLATSTVISAAAAPAPTSKLNRYNDYSDYDSS